MFMLKEDICSIPINEIFDIKDGCPICRMRNELEEKALKFTLGPAMMEPEVRKETNELGFCKTHYKMMYEMKNKLQLALVLESHVDKVLSDIFEAHNPSLLKKNQAAALEAAKHAHDVQESCYICKRIDSSLDKALNTFFVMWKKDEDFRKNVETQPYYCLDHYALLLEKGSKVLTKDEYVEFYQSLKKCSTKGVTKIKEDVSGFVKMYDYRNNGKDFGELHGAVERAVKLFTGKNIK